MSGRKPASDSRRRLIAYILPHCGSCAVEVERLLKGSDESDAELIRRQLAELMSEHRDLDDVIARLADAGPFDQLQIQRLKKRKLLLKDEIAKLESKLLPDIIA